MKQGLFLLFLFLFPPLRADSVMLQWDNDVVFNTDHSYTNGFSLGWLDDAYRLSDANATDGDYSRSVLHAIPWLRPDAQKRYSSGISLYQMIITPDDKSSSSANYNDVPYAGYLALSLFFFVWDEAVFDEYRLEVGVVGPKSAAESSQKTLHQLRGLSELAGWDTQLGTHWTANMMYQHGAKVWQKRYRSGWEADWIYAYGLQAGNFHTAIFGGTVGRIGKNYVQNFNLFYPYLKSEASLLGNLKRHRGTGWSLSSGINTEAIAYSYIFDEATKQGYNIHKSDYSTILFAAMSLYVDSAKMTFFLQSQSPYIKESDTWMNFGGIKLLLSF